MNQETDKIKCSTSKFSIWRMFAGLLLVGIGFLSGKAWNADQLRQEAQIERKEGIKEIRKEVVKSLKPMQETLKNDVNDAMMICTEAAFRSIRAADTVQKAQDTVDVDIDTRKEAIERAIKKGGSK